MLQVKRQDIAGTVEEALASTPLNSVVSAVEGLTQRDATAGLTEEIAATLDAVGLAPVVNLVDSVTKRQADIVSDVQGLEQGLGLDAVLTPLEAVTGSLKRQTDTVAGVAAVTQELGLDGALAPVKGLTNSLKRQADVIGAVEDLTQALNTDSLLAPVEGITNSLKRQTEAATDILSEVTDLTAGLVSDL